MAFVSGVSAPRAVAAHGHAPSGVCDQGLTVRLPRSVSAMPSTELRRAAQNVLKKAGVWFVVCFSLCRKQFL